MATNLAKWVLHWSGANDEGQVGCYVQLTAPMDQAACEDAVNAFLDNWAASDTWAATLRHLLGTDQAFDRVAIYSYPNPLAPATASAEGSIAAGDGTGTGTSLTPLQSSICVSLLTGHSGASYRGRMYLPLTGQGLSTGHQIDPSILDNVGWAVAGSETGTDNLLAQFSVCAESGGAPTGVFSRKLNLFTPLTAVRIDSVSDVQRRRAEQQVPLHVNHTDLQVGGP